MSWGREKLLVLSAFAMAVAALLNNYPFLLLTAVACFVISLYLIYGLISKGETTRFFLLSSLACGAWICAAFLQSAVYIVRGEYVFSSLFTESSIAIDVRDYALAFSYVFLFILGCSVLSRLSLVVRPEEDFDIYCVESLRSVSLRTWSTVLFVVSLFLAILAFSGLLSIRGLGEDYSSEEGILPWWYVVITLLLTTMPLLISQVFTDKNKVFSIPVFIGIFGFFVGIYYSSLAGRFASVAFIILILFCWVVIQRPRLRLTSRVLFIGVVAIFAVALLLPYVNKFLAFLNIARNQQGLYTNPLLFLQEFIDFVSTHDSVLDALDRSSENLASRPLVLWPLAVSIRMAAEGLNSDYLYFADLFNSALNAFPRLLIPWKGELLLQENLLYSRFPFANVDTADSPYLYAFASFGIFGIAIYPLAIATVYVLFLRFATLSSRHGIWLPTALASTSTLINLAIISYGELATTGLWRQFVVPGAIAMACLSGGLLKIRRG